MSSGRRPFRFWRLAMLVVMAVALSASCTCGGNGSDAGDACTRASCEEPCREAGACFGGCDTGVCQCTACDADADAEVPDAPPDDAQDEADGTDAADSDADVETREDAPWETPEGCCTVPDGGRDCVGPVDERLVGRTVGESWCYLPTVDDLSASWFEPAPGCEQVTYESFLYLGDWARWDVAGEQVVISNAEGVRLYDSACRCREQIHEPGHEGIQTHDARLSASAGVYQGTRYIEGDEQYVVSFEPATYSKRLLAYREPRLVAGTSDPTGFLYPVGLFERLAAFARVPGLYAGCDYDFIWMDVATGESGDLTQPAFPSGVCMWDAQARQPYVTITGGDGIIIIDTVARTASRFLPPGPDPTCEFSGDIADGTICWASAPSASRWCTMPTGAGTDILCGDLTGTSSWIASDPAVDTVYGPGVAPDWIAYAEAVPGNDVRLYYRRLDRQFSLFDRTAPSFDPRGPDSGGANPRIEGDWLYFQVGGPDPVRQQGNLYRCNLRTLFPEAYE